MVGARPHVTWGALAGGLARNFANWRQFCVLTPEAQEQQFVGTHGSRLMTQDIEEALPEAWATPLESSAPRWMEAFTRFEVLIVVRGCTAERIYAIECGLERGHVVK